MRNMSDMYADELVRQVRAEVTADPERYGRCRSWTDLHDVCDANEFLICVGDTFGYPVGDPEWFLSPEGQRIEHDAIGRVNAEVFGGVS